MPTLADQIAPKPQQPSGLGGWLASIGDELAGAFARYGRRSGAQRDASLALLNQASAPGTDPIMGAGQKLLGLAGLITHPLAFFPTREEWDQRLQAAGNDSRLGRSIGGFLSDLPSLIDPQMAAGGAVLATAPLAAKVLNKADDVADASRAADAAANSNEFVAYKGARPYTGGKVINGNGKYMYDEKLEEIKKWESPSTHLGGGYAGFFSSSPEVASRFAELYNPGAVFRTKIKFNNPYVIDAGGRKAAEFQFDRAGWPGPKEIQAALQNSDHDGVIIKNTKDEGDVYIPKSHSQITDYIGGK